MRLMITAPASNSGKTAITCGLLAMMKKRGLKTCAFKCGPDYIDPMFHRSVLGIESRNLDIFLAGEEGVRRIFERGSRGAEAVICEGVMGYYDGIDDREASDNSGLEPGRFKASGWHISRLLGIPALLVIRPKGAALSLAAVIKGMAEFRSPSNIAGVIFNDCSRAYFDTYAEMIQAESGVPVLGYLPHMEEAEFDSRHLGLMTASEIEGLQGRIGRIAEKMSETIDLERLIGIYSDRSDDPVADLNATSDNDPSSVGGDGSGPRIAVAMDEAFCFMYKETLEALSEAGAEPVFFSPIHDRELPAEIGGLYLPGGYPELYADRLSKNGQMRRQIRDAVISGLPTVAECGGFLYLGSQLEDTKGESWPMVGALSGSAKNAGKLVRFGYGRIEANEDSLLFRAGERIPVHEFHYWDTTDKGSDLELIKARDGSSWRFGHCSGSLYAGFPHLYMAAGTFFENGDGPAARFVEAARACCSQR